MGKEKATACRSILVVEDDPNIRECLCELLRSEGYPVVSAQDGAEALEKLTTIVRPTLVLLDLMMPRVNGWEVLQTMRAKDHLAPIPVIITSASADIRSLHGANDIIKKPYDLTAMLELVAKYCGKPDGQSQGGVGA
jgi:chemosensory pili system protein ChpA (sensor histidine kinase/response regulator)